MSLSPQKWFTLFAAVLLAGLCPRPAGAVCNFTTDKVQTLNGTILSYRLTIMNNTASGFRGLYLTDTVSPALTNQTCEAPPEFGTATIFDTPSGTLYTWAYDLGGSGPSILGKDETWTFTITGTLPDACALFGIQNTAFFRVAGSGCSGFAAEGTNTVGTSANLLVTDIMDPPSPAAGGPVSYMIVVENTGTVTLTALSIADTVSAAITGITVETPPGFAAQGPVATGGGNWYGWQDTGGLQFAEGAVLTFTITGTVATTCVAATVSNTAFAVGITVGCGASATETISNVVSFDIPTPPVGIELSLTRTGGTGAGAPVAYRIVVTNIGDATATSLILVDTVPSLVTNLATSQPAGMGAPAVVSVPGGTRFVWSESGFTLSPTGSFTFTITGNIGVTCALTNVSNSAYAVAAAACARSDAMAVPDSFDVSPPSGGIQADLFQSAGGSSGSPVTYRIVVTNTGSETISDITVTDTVSAIVVDQATAQPAAVGPPLVTGVPAEGTRYVWSATAMPAGLPPGRSFTFTVTGNMGVACAPTTVTNTAYVETAAGCSVNRIATNGVAALVTPPVAAISVVARQTPAGPSSGQAVTYRIVVTNLGTATLTALTVTDTVSPAVTGAAGSQPAGWAPAAITEAAPTGTVFAWSNSSLTFGPQASLTFTITGTVGTCYPGVVSNTPFVTAGNSCSMTAQTGNVTAFPLGAVLAASASVQPIVSTGQWFDVKLTVTNTGNDLADLVSGTVAVAPGASRVALVAGPVPPGPVSIPAGAMQTFAWTFSAAGTGSATFTMTASGLSCGGAPIRGRGWIATTIQSPAALVASVAATPSPRDTGQTFILVMSVQNTGAATAFNVTADAFTPSGPGAAAWLAGPSAPFPVNLVSGARAAFTWTFTGVSAGAVWLTATLTGTDANSGKTVSTGPVVSATELIQTPAALVSAVSISQAVVSTGQWFTTTLTVTNTGQATAIFTIPGIVDRSSATLAVTSVPAPGPFTIAGGGSTTFSWTWSPAGAGAIAFSLSAGGADANTLLRVFTSQPVAGLAEVAAALQPSIALSATSVSPGASLVATVTVTNTGEATATGILPPSLLFSGYGAVTVTSFPPAVPVTLNGSQVVTWSWGLTAVIEGSVTITATVTGVDANSARTVAGAAFLPLQVGAPRLDISSLAASPAEVELDRVITLVMAMTNTGRFALTDVRPAPLAIAGDGVVLGLTGPQPASAAALLPNESATFAWTFRSIRGGTVVFRDGVLAAGTSFPAIDANPVRIVEAGGSLKDAIVYPTPFDPATALMGGLRFRHMPPFTEVKIYTNAGDLVRALKADDDGLAIWDARNSSGSRVSAGIYFFVMQTVHGERRRGKFEVSR